MAKQDFLGRGAYQTSRRAGSAAPSCAAKKGELSGWQRHFVGALDSSGNATEAYIKAGYKARGAAARANASRMLTKANVRAALATSGT